MRQREGSFYMIELPEKFCERMKVLLGDEYEDFIKEYDKIPFKGLRVNVLKCTVEKLNSLLKTELKPSPFSPLSFYTDPNKKLGNHPLHHAGAFYLQEPSASSAVTVLDVQHGEKILDLCASPGGKSTQIASLLDGTGLLWSNEFVRNRTTALLSNIERLGIKNCIISSLSPAVLCGSLKGYFDKVLVDAPCSGEGMFRKDPQAVTEWSADHVVSCGERQLQILDSAKLTLKDGGVLVYSTCTFSVEENERVIERFLEKNTDFSLCDCSYLPFGRGGYGMPQVRRIYPMDGGEGHFVAKLVRNGGECGYTPEHRAKPLHTDKTVLENARTLYRDIFKSDNSPEFTVVGDKLMIMPSVMPEYKGGGILRSGILFGEIKKNRVEPAHHLFTCGKMNDFNRAVNFDISSDWLNRFLFGEEIPVSPSLKGYTAVCVEDIPLGFGKASGGKLKNKYPKGLRKVK